MNEVATKPDGAPRGGTMRLYVEPMDVVVVDVSEDGRVRFEDGEWALPTLQERRAIVYAADAEIEVLREVVERLGGGRPT